MNPLYRRLGRVLPVLMLVALLAPIAAIPVKTEVAKAAPIGSRSFFGMNLYITGLERPKGEKMAMLNAAEDLGVKWSREEMSWANLEPGEKGSFNWGPYDPWINELVKRGIGVVGTLQTTPSWASGVHSDQPDWYWNAPRNPQDFVDFAYQTALHYAGKIDVWEIWNEPDVEITFKCGGCDRAALYAEMLSGSYAAIKKANPKAVVLIGGLSIHDSNNGGMAFLDAVVAASGGRLNFDVLSIHPYMPDRMPESTDPKTVVQNFPYRLDMSYKWLQAHGAEDKEIWITEDGYSTCSECGTLGVSEEEQARRLIRLHVIAMGAPNVTHFSYFQAKDKFNAGSADLWGNMGIMRNDLSEKPAYVAYRVLNGQLADATFTGLGTITRAVQNRWQAQFDRYHYKFVKAGATIQVLWKIGVPESVDVPVEESSVVLVKSDGTNIPLTVRDGLVSVTISEDPIFIDEIKPKATANLDAAVDTSSPTGLRPANRFLAYWQKSGGLPLFGYPISGERIEKSSTDGKEYIVQWFERARFEYHPEYAGTDAEVLLGLLGSQSAAGRSFPQIAPPAGAQSLCAKETGHCVWGRFLEQWREMGIALVGLPISDQFEEKSSDGKTYIVQWFERARFEYHPENKPPFDVLLGLLGRQLYKK
ncbi:MAG: hypothetical protein ABI670_07920 [Chloroflexota bacterium]